MRRLTVLAAIISVVASLSASGAEADDRDATIVPATGGSAISAGTAGSGGSGVFTELTGPAVHEEEPSAVRTGWLAVRSPAGFELRQAPVRVVATSTNPSNSSLRISPTSSCSNAGTDIQVTPAATTVRLYVCTTSGGGRVKNNLTFSKLGVRPTAGSPLASGRLCLDDSTPNAVDDVRRCGLSNPTSWGDLAEVPATAKTLSLNPAQSTIAAGGTQSYRAIASDGFGNSFDVTGSTALSIAPTGACAGASCSAAVAVTHTVTGSYQSIKGTARLDVQNAPAPAQPASFDVQSSNASTMTGASGANVYAIPRSNISPVVVTFNAVCPAGGSPSGVTLVASGNVYPMTAGSGGSWTATVPQAQVSAGSLVVSWMCPDGPLQQTLGSVELYDPTGLITEILQSVSSSYSTRAAASRTEYLQSASAPSLTPLRGATVTLFRVSGYRAETAPDSDPTTCQTMSTRPSGGFNQPPPTDPALNVRVNPSDGTIAPSVNPFITNSLGMYGWLAAPGCYDIVVSMAGKRTRTSMMAGIPPAVTDLDLTLYADADPQTTISSGPNAITTSTTADFVFSSNDPEATFTCSLDAAAASSCQSPVQLSGLTDGTHTFTVTAIAPNGKADKSPSTATWSIESHAPDVQIIRPTSGETYVFNSTVPAGVGNPAVAGSVTVEARVIGGPSGIAAFTFKVDGTAVPASAVRFDAARSVYAFDYAPSAAGQHSIVASATSGLGLTGSDTLTMLVVTS